jgi:hypothetical protein
MRNQTIDTPAMSNNMNIRNIEYIIEIVKNLNIKINNESSRNKYQFIHILNNDY